MKRFLILVLMALLSAAGWGVDFKASQTQPVDEFARNSIAFLNGTQYSAQAAATPYTTTLATARNTTAIITSTTDGTVITGGGVGGANVIPQCSISGVLYGLEGNLIGRVCYSADGITWTRTADATTYSSIWATPAGNLMAWNNTTKVLYRSANSGASFTDVTPSGDNAMSATAVIFPRWCIRNNGNVMLMAEYGPSVVFGGRYIFRSTDDGVTWTRCFDAVDITATEANQIYHFHGLGYHAATGRWIATMGDGLARRCNVYSDDNGLTWTVLNAPTTYFTQPLGGFIDYGDPYYLICGDDGYSSIQKFDVRDGTLINVYNGFSSELGKYYVFDIAYYGGVFYALKATTTASIYDMSIVTSNDGTNWTVYHNFSVGDKISAVYYAGYCNGKLHFFAVNAVDSVTKHFKVTPARFSTVTGVEVSPASENVLSEANSSVEANIGNWNIASSPAGWTIAASTDYAVHGTKSIKIVTPAAGDAILRTVQCSANFTLTVGETYYCSFYFRGGDITLSASIWDNTESAARGAVTYYSGNSWREARTLPFTVAEGDEANVHRIFISVPAHVGQRTIYIDAIQVIKAPYNPWQVGGTAKVADALTETVTTAKVWSDVFAIRAKMLNTYYALSPAAALTIKTWALDANNKIVLTYDPADLKFKITRTIAGSAKSVVSSAATYWHGESCIKFILRVSGTAVNLDIQNGRAIETLSDGGMAALLDAEIVGTYGDFPMVVLTGWNLAQFIPLWIPDTDVTAVMNLMTPEYLKLSSGKTGTLGTQTHDTLGNSY